MPETIECKVSGDQKWHWYNVMKDLEEQGGLAEVKISPQSVNPHGCSGITKAGTLFVITWIYNVFLLISTSQEEQALIDAFAKVVGYQPFCKYVSKDSGLLTFEWDKQDPKGRFTELQKAGELNLEKVN